MYVELCSFYYTPHAHLVFDILMTGVTSYHVSYCHFRIGAVAFPCVNAARAAVQTMRNGEMNGKTFHMAFMSEKDFFNILRNDMKMKKNQPCNTVIVQPLSSKTNKHLLRSVFPKSVTCYLSINRSGHSKGYCIF